jgi:hypothetical protein
VTYINLVIPSGVNPKEAYLRLDTMNMAVIRWEGEFLETIGLGYVPGHRSGTAVPSSSRKSSVK